MGVGSHISGMGQKQGLRVDLVGGRTPTSR